MARPLTHSEKVKARECWPRMDVDAVVVSGEANQRYNCLAWTLGITTSWVWPFGLNPTKDEFDALYRSHGFTPAVSGTIAVFGLDLNQMRHGSISGAGHGPRWESKGGAWLRIQHGLGEMEGGDIYGDVLGYYRRISDELPQASARLQTLREAEAVNELINLSDDQLTYARTRAAQVDEQLKERFKQTYAAWRETWDQPLIALNSAPSARAQTKEFRDLVALGSDILPLLMEKLTDPEEFFALVAVDSLGPELKVTRELDDEMILLGEQGRAVETIQRWVAAESRSPDR